MSARVSVRSLQTGHRDQAVTTPTVTVAVKSATTPGEHERLLAEADRIRQLSHPGVVAFVDLVDEPPRTELHTRYVGPALDRWSGTFPQVAGLMAALATTVSELHDAGVVHGRIEPSHVLVGPDGRPVLCGLAPPPDSSVPADDVAALGELLRVLLGAADEHASRSPWRKLIEPAAPRRRLMLACDRATDPSTERRPTARALSRAILDAVPDATLPESSGAATPEAATANPPETAPSQELFDAAFVDLHTTGEEEIFADRPWQEPERGQAGPAVIERRWPRSDRPRHRPAALAVAAASVALGLTVVGAWSVLTQSDQSPQAGARSAGDGPTGPEHTSSESDCPQPTVGTDDHGRTYEVDVTGDGCTEAVAVTAAGVVVVGDERWAVGDPDDIVTLGDWDCTGTATPALYRQSTGDVFVFTEWADHGHPQRVEPVGRVPGGVAILGSSHLADRPVTEGCDVPVVELASGGYHPVEVTTVG